MLKEIGKRVALILAIFLTVMVIFAFASVKLKEKVYIQNNHFRYYMEATSSEGEVDMSMEKYAFFLAKRDFYSEESFSEQCYNTFKDMFRLDFGYSHYFWNVHEPAKDKVIKAFPKTIILLCTSQFMIIVGGIFLGLKSAHPTSTLGKIVSYLGPVTSGIPSWWIAGILLFLFAFKYDIFPFSGYISLPPKTGVSYYLDVVYHMVLPVAALVLTKVWGFAYICRNITLKEMGEDYVTTARAKGLPERKVLYGHVLRTSMPGIVTMSMYSFLEFISSCLVVEIIFSWKGLGNLFYNSFQLVWAGDEVRVQADVNLFIATSFFIILMYLASFIILEVVYNMDPRIRVMK